MPIPHAHLTPAVVADHIHSHVFGAVGHPAADRNGQTIVDRNGIGVELEFLTTIGSNRARVPTDEAERLIAQLTPLPGGGRLTIEPGGQLELSSACFAGLAPTLDAVAHDLYLLDQAAAGRGIELFALGIDPHREPERTLAAPRYEAMAAFFDHDGSAGRTMMCNTSSIQVNVGLGPDEQVRARWCLANALCPTLTAAFANSPFGLGGPSGWRSTRMRSWLTLDPTRSAAPRTQHDPIERFIDYALDARVMMIRLDGSPAPGDGPPRHEPSGWRPEVQAITDPLTFGQWMTVGHELGWPTLDDFTYHLTTLFPPVRPKGWFEIRTIDALPTPFWQVAAAVTSVLLTEPDLHAEARAALAGTEDLWLDAAQLGLGHPGLRRAAVDILRLAVDALEQRDDDIYAELTAAYLDRWVGRGRTPGDDLLDEWRRSGRLQPPRQSPVRYAQDLLVEIDQP